MASKFQGPSCPCHSGVDLHQFTSMGSCPGISGKCDLNRLTGTKDETWFTGSVGNTAPAGKTADRVIAIAQKEVGYLEKKSNKDLESKTANAGKNNYTKYSAVFGVNGCYLVRILHLLAVLYVVRE